MKKVLLITLIVVALVGGLWLLGNNNNEESSASVSEEQINDSLASRTYGNLESQVVLEEFGDFECPSCAQFFPIVTQIKELYKDDIQFVYRHFPLQQIHLNARAAHRASEAAAMQGKFWEMHDLLFENQPAWRNSQTASQTFEAFASQIDLDMDKYREDVASTLTNGQINEDLRIGGERGVTGTPTFFLNGQNLNLRDVDTVEKFSQLIDEALGRNTENDQ